MSTCRNFDVCLNAKNSFLTSFLKRYCNIANLSTLRMLDHVNQKWKHNLIENFDTEINLQETLMFICIQNIYFISNFFFWYCKDIANMIFWELSQCLTIPIKNAGNFHTYLHAKSQPHHLLLSEDTAKE